MRRLLLAALALGLMPALAEAAVRTLPVTGSLATADGQPVANLQGSITFDAETLLADFDVVPASNFSLHVTTLVDLPGLPAGSVVGFPPATVAFEPFAEPTIGLRDGWYFVDFLAAGSFAAVDLRVEAEAYGDLLQVFASDFTLLAEGSLAVVPLPAGLWFLATGLVGLAVLRRRRPPAP